MSRHMMTPELDKINCYRGIGTACHELGHILGVPDFYDNNHAVDGSFPATGTWDLMSAGNWNSYTNTITSLNPAHPNPYIKTEIFKWATAKELVGNDKLYTLRPSELDSNSIYKLSTSTPGEYYFLENRQGIGLPGIGLVIYHVNAEIENIASNEINNKHPQNLYVVDANNHIDKPTNSVDSYGNIDTWYAPFWNYYSKNMYFTSTSKPSNCAWDGTPTENKDVCFISEVLAGNENWIRFVLNPEISGPDILCDSAIYSIKYLPSNANIKWSYIRPSDAHIASTPLILNWGEHNKNVCFRRGYNILGVIVDPEPGEPILPIAPNSNTRSIVTTPYYGAVTIKADIFLYDDTLNAFTLTKEIYMPRNLVIDDMGYGEGNPLRPNTPYLFSLKYPVESNWESNVEWTISDINGTYTRYGNSTVVNTGNSIAISIIAKHLVDCNNTKSDTLFLQVIPNGGVTFQNPASGNVEISVIGGSANNEINNTQTLSINQSEPYMGAYRLELWHDIYGKVREMDVPENTPTVTMNVDGLNSGIYILRLIIDNQLIQTSQMIIK